MKSKNTKKDLKINKLIELLNDTKNGVPIEEICQSLDCNRQSAHSYIKQIQEVLKMTITKETKNRKAYYSLNTNTTVYNPLTFNTLREYTILKEIQKRQIQKNDLQKYFFEINCKTKNNTIEPIPLDLKNTQYYSLINSLIQRNEIIIKNNIYYATTKNIPLRYTITEDELSNLNIELQSISPGNPYYENLHNILVKTNQLLGTFDEDTCNNYILYGTKKNKYSTIKSSLQRIEKYDYINNRLDITFHTNDNEDYTVDIGIGLIVYSVDKDELYIIGKNYSKDCLNAIPNLIIKFSSIIEITDNNSHHNCFQSDEFLNIYKYMFSISVDTPQEVYVIFEKFGNIENKIKYLCSQREYSSMIIEDNNIIYKDKISGLNDFANYLRQFGKSVKVIAPEELKNKMNNSVLRSLERYGEINEN